jgi:hypothetical protein
MKVDHDLYDAVHAKAYRNKDSGNVSAMIAVVDKR